MGSCRLRTAGAVVAGALAGLLIVTGLTPVPALGVAGGAPTPDQGYGFVAHIEVGDAVRGCSGALIDPEWVVTVSSCFATGGQPVTAGPPATPTTVTVGRADLASTTGGQVRAVAEVVPHPSRDLLLAKLASPVADVSPVKVGAATPAADETLRVAGYGRTGAAWVPDRLHTATLSVRTVGETTIGLAAVAEAPASICKGDAGGPALRQVGAAFELVALHSAAWQAGCLETPADETRTEAVETRLDNVLDWLRQTVRGGNFVRLPNSAAILDTRSAIGAPTGVRAANSVTSFQVTGVGGVPASGVSAVLLDVTAVTTTSATHLTVFPEGTPRNPALSMLNAAASQTISNSAVVNLPASGKLSVHTSGGGVHIVIDVQGYYTRTPTTGGGFVPVDFTRVVDTRSGLGGSAGTIPAGGSRAFTLTGGVIPTGAAVAFLDLIVTGATRQGWVGTFATGGTNRSVMDFVAGTMSHAVSARLGADGRATFTNNSGAPIHMVMTATGYYTASPTTGAGLRTITAVRKLDTRNVGNRTPLPANGTVDVALGLPAGSAAVVNLTVANNTAAGYLRAWPVDGTEPTASLTNYPTPNTSARAGLAVVRAGTDGKIRVRNVGSGTVHLLVDVQGWYVPASATVTGGSAADGAGATIEEALDDPTETNGGSIVEDFRYPSAAQILATQNVNLLSGDGHILLADCATPPQGDIGLLKVFTTDETIGADGIGRVCFRVTASSGWLSLQVPGVYEIRGDGQRTGTGHEVTAELVADDGEELTVEVDPDGSTQVGQGADPNAPPTTLLKLVVTG
jgi:hypothetical protein